MNNIKIYHLPFCPKSRAIRVILSEIGVDYDLHFEKIWDMRSSFVKMSPFGDIPVMIDSNSNVMVGFVSCFEKIYTDTHNKIFFNGTNNNISETRRLYDLIFNKFYNNAYKQIVNERVYKYMANHKKPNIEKIKKGRINFHIQLEYINYLINDNHLIIGDMVSAADIIVASYISCFDYLNEIPWDKYPKIKDWYGRIKSRKSFRYIFTDRLNFIAPSAQYSNLDF